MAYRAAIASTDQENVNEHFGRCRVFLIAEANEDDGSYKLTERRPVASACPSCGRLGESDDAINRVVEALSDCDYVIVSRIGRWPDSLLYERGIQSVEYRGVIKDAMNFVFQKRRDKIDVFPGL
ncbi:MAG: hypothetical protein LBT08_09500 [Synergistaceae bacterium]|jgi:predicted Fe-Mo cluster-binding NifX family protein|nr:hypothetical protein [Synergistaceae bacterium]